MKLPNKNSFDQYKKLENKTYNLTKFNKKLENILFNKAHFNEDEKNDPIFVFNIDFNKNKELENILIQLVKENNLNEKIENKIIKLLSSYYAPRKITSIFNRKINLEVQLAINPSSFNAEKQYIINLIAICKIRYYLEKKFIYNSEIEDILMLLLNQKNHNEKSINRIKNIEEDLKKQKKIILKEINIKKKIFELYRASSNKKKIIKLPYNAFSQILYY